MEKQNIIKQHKENLKTLLPFLDTKEHRDHKKCIYAKDNRVYATNGKVLVRAELEIEDGMYLPEVVKNSVYLERIDSEYPDVEEICSSIDDTYRYFHQSLYDNRKKRFSTLIAKLGQDKVFISYEWLELYFKSFTKNEIDGIELNISYSDESSPIFVEYRDRNELLVIMPFDPKL